MYVAARCGHLDGGFALAAVTTDLDVATDDAPAPQSRLQMFRTTRNPRWLLGWFDLEWKANRTVVPEHGTNARDLDFPGGRVAAHQQVEIYPADVLPARGAIGVPVKLERKAAIEHGRRAEPPDAARHFLRHQ